jgi:hypothetical protein
MPAGDGTGPRGMGSRTGRGAGYCSGYGMPGYANPISGRGYGLGRGFGMGRGGGWGRRNWYYATGVPGWARYPAAPAWGTPPVAPYGPYAAAPSVEQETEVLRNQAEWLKDQLEAITKRLEEIESKE